MYPVMEILTGHVSHYKQSTAYRVKILKIAGDCQKGEKLFYSPINVEVRI